jgi:REP element-mobilizing transposase RayT
MPESLHCGEYYHIYNRGNNGELIFLDERNPAYFLSLYAKYVAPVAATYAYCLVPYHFHLLVRIRDDERTAPSCERARQEKHGNPSPSLAFSKLFSAYAKAINREYGRTGSLFEKPFRRKLIDSDAYFVSLVAYIHRNPQKHGLVADFRPWPLSSYRAILSTGQTQIEREAVLDWFGGREQFVRFHEHAGDDTRIAPLVRGDEWW